MRNIRMLAIGLASLALPLSLTAGGLTPLAAAAVPAATPILTSGIVLPAEVTGPSNSLTFNPVANAKGGSITATFVGLDKVKNRPVILKRSLDGLKWGQIGPKKGVKLSSSGTAVFKVTPEVQYTYQAVAKKYTYKVKKKKRTAVEALTAPTQLSQQWALPFVDDFGPDSSIGPGKTWNWTLTGNNGAGNRWCSVPVEANATLFGGKAVLSMTKADEATRSWVIPDVFKRQQAAKDAALAKAVTSKQKAAAQAMKVNGCPNGVFANARISTEQADGFRIKDGIVAAEITFPINQGGHGGIWLRTKNNKENRFDEIDIVEAFGWKKGIQSVLHWGTICSETDDRKCETTEKAKWVAKKTVGKSSWWGKPHVFSAEFGSDRVIFRVDGVVTRVDNHVLPDAEYSLVMSMLSSDYELGRLKKPVNGNKKKAKLPLSTTVNWVRAWTPVAAS